MSNPLRIYYVQYLVPLTGNHQSSARRKTLPNYVIDDVRLGDSGSNPALTDHIHKQ